MTKDNGRLDRIEQILDETAIITKSNARQLKETDRYIKNVAKEVGKVTNGLGNIAEGLVAPALPKVFRKLGITGIRPNALSRLNGHAMEIDVLGVGEHIVVLCECRSTLNIEEVKEFSEKVPRFYKFFTEYKGWRVAAAVAGIKVSAGVIDYAQRQGLYVLSSSGETIQLVNNKNFKPKFW